MASKLMIVIGALEDEDHVKTVVNNVHSGIEKWIDSLNAEDRQGVIKELNSIPKKESLPECNAAENSAVLRYRGEELDTTILIGPTSENLHYELVDFFLSGACRCFISYGGFVTEDKADWYLQDGLFSFTNIQLILKDPKISSALSEKSCKISISCCKLGSWASTEEILKNLSSDKNFKVEVMDISQELHTNGVNSGDQSSPSKSAEEQRKPSNIEEFSEFLEDGIGNEIGGIFNTLKPPLQEGFLKIRNPCLYIFPGGHGDSAFFAVNGFNMLVNGGACTKPWFWKLIQHVDRVDGILATHPGSDNLPGINSLLLRKLQERQVKLPMDNTTPEYKELHRCLISPDLGPLFFNVPSKFLEAIGKTGSSSESPRANGKLNGASPAAAKEDDPIKHPVLKTVDVVKDTLRLSKALNMEIVPLVRKPGTHPEPITLFSKVGLGRLEMYILSPSESSKEFAYVNEKWGCNGKTTTPTGRTGVVNAAGGEGDSTVTNLSSICCLLVWHPSNPHERIVRVLFPGNAPQTKIFEGLEMLKNLPFLKSGHVTKHSLNKQKHSAKTNGSHPPRGARPASAVAATKKPTSAAPRVGGSQVKREATSGTSKPADKRLKTEKPATSKAKPALAATNKSNAQKEKPPTKTVKQDMDGDKAASTSKSTTVKKSAPSRATTSSTASSEAKRASAAPAKPGSSKQRQVTKPNEKPKKPQTLSNLKPKAEPRKAPSATSLSTPARKTAPKKSPMKQTSKTPSKSTTKVAKKQKEEPQPVTVTPPEDLTPDFKKVEASDQRPENSVEPMSTGSEEPSTSVLSDRHSPEGEDMVHVSYTETPAVVVEDKDQVKQDPDDGQDIIQPSEQVQEDAGFVIMNKPEISEESDFISENGSSSGARQQNMAEDEKVAHQLEPPKESELISSDLSTPTPEDPKPEKVISFTVPDEDTESAFAQDRSGVVARVIDRHPTPFHSLQESSASGDSPLTDEMVAVTDVDQEVIAEVDAGNVVAGREEGCFESQQEQLVPDQEKLPTDEQPALGRDEHEDQQVDAMILQQEVVHQKEDDTIDQGEVARDQEDTIEHQDLLFDHEEPKQECLGDNLKDIGSDIQSSFNSSMEGSYELYPGGRSTPPPSDRQETIAETISDFKHDEIPSTKEFEDPSACLDTQPQQVELLEDPTMSTEAPDPRYSVSSTSTGSRFARMDSPFSPSEVGMSNTSEYAAQQARADHAQVLSPKFVMTSRHTEDDISSLCGQTADLSLSTDAAFSSSNVATMSSATPAAVGESEGIGTHADNGGVLGAEVTHFQEEVLAGEKYDDEDDADDDDDVEDVDIQDDEDEDDRSQEHPVKVMEEQLHADEFGGRMQQAPEEVLDNYPRQGWSQEEDDDSEAEERDDFDLHAGAGAPPDNINSMHDQEEREETAEEKHQVLDNVQFLMEDAPEPYPDTNLNDNEVAGGGEGYQEEDDKMQMTGSLASSAQDQGQGDEYSESASLTETGATPDVEQPPGGFDYDGPCVKEYEQVEDGVISKSDLSLSSPEDNFLLHGGIADANLAELNENEKEKPVSSEIQHSEEMVDGPAEPMVDEQLIGLISPQRYHPAYVDPSAPLADSEEGQEDLPKIESPLDVHAKPFVPKSSVPFDHSPKHGAEAPFDLGQQEMQGDGFPSNGGFDMAPQASQPAMGDAEGNPFLVDLMSASPVDPFACDLNKDASLPPMRGPDPCAAQDKNAKTSQKKAGAAGAGSSRKVSSGSSPVFVDLAYVPNHANKSSVGVDFFKKIRARYYVISGDDLSRDEPSKEVLNHLLDGKRSWFGDPGPHASDHDDNNVTVIPTHDTNTIREWYQQNFKELESCNIHMVASGSKVLVQVESIEACKIEF